MAPFVSTSHHGQATSNTNTPDSTSRSRRHWPSWAFARHPFFAAHNVLRTQRSSSRSPTSPQYHSPYLGQTVGTHPSINQHITHSSSTSIGRQSYLVPPLHTSQHVAYHHAPSTSNAGLGVTFEAADAAGVAGSRTYYAPCITKEEVIAHAHAQALDYDSSSPASLQGPFTPPLTADTKFITSRHSLTLPTSANFHTTSPYLMASPNYSYHQYSPTPYETPCPPFKESPHFFMHNPVRPMFYGFPNQMHSPQHTAPVVSMPWTPPMSSGSTHFDHSQPLGRITSIDSDDFDDQQLSQSNPQFIGAHDFPGLPISDEEEDDDGHESTVSDPVISCNDEIASPTSANDAAASPATASDSDSSTAGSTQDRSLDHLSGKDRFLVEMRRKGLSYKDIKEQGNFQEAESTLRGKHRMLTKDKCERVRRPEWTKHDLELLHMAVRKLGRTRVDRMHRETCRLPWKQISAWIKEHGGSYLFAPATCARKWDSIQRCHSRGTQRRRAVPVAAVDKS